MKAIETCNRIIKRYGPDPSSFLLRGISKCRIQAVGLGRIDIQRALERLTEVKKSCFSQLGNTIMNLKTRIKFETSIFGNIAINSEK